MARYVSIVCTGDGSHPSRECNVIDTHKFDRWHAGEHGTQILARCPWCGTILTVEIGRRVATPRKPRRRRRQRRRARSARPARRP